MKRRLSILAVTAGALALSLSGVARADSTLGTTSIPSGAGPGACAGDIIAQATSDASAPYTVPGPGTINQWKIYAGPPSSPGSSVTFVVLKPGSGFMTVVGSNTQSIPNPAPAGDAAYTIAAPIAVSGGETLGLWTPGSAVVCYLSGGATPVGNTLSALDSALSPIPGQTVGFSGSNSPPGYRMNLSANFVPTPPAKKKKCKKKKKHKSGAELAKKKKCKKKKKKG